LEGTRSVVFSKSTTLFRATGLCPGMGELGTLSAVFFLYYAIFFVQKVNIYKSLTGMVLSSILIILSQSRTSLIGFGVALFVLLTLLCINRKRYIRKRSAMLIMLSIIILIIVVIFFSSYIHYFKLFFEHGTELSSFEGRKDIWRNLLSIVYEIPILLPFGYGRLAFPDQSVFDNEYIYFFIIQGVFISLLFYGILFLSVFRYLMNWKYLDGIKPLIISILIMGLVCSIGLFFFTEPVKSIITTLLVCSINKFKQFTLKT
jgi:O-antigen ligase